MNFELGFMYRMEMIIPTSEGLGRITNCICRMSDTEGVSSGHSTKRSEVHVVFIIHLTRISSTG